MWAWPVSSSAPAGGMALGARGQPAVERLERRAHGGAGVVVEPGRRGRRARGAPTRCRAALRRARRVARDVRRGRARPAQLAQRRRGGVDHRSCGLVLAPPPAPASAGAPAGPAPRPARRGERAPAAGRGWACRTASGRRSRPRPGTARARPGTPCARRRPRTAPRRGAPAPRRRGPAAAARRPTPPAPRPPGGRTGARRSVRPRVARADRLAVERPVVESRHARRRHGVELGDPGLEPLEAMRDGERQVSP